MSLRSHGSIQTIPASNSIHFGDIGGHEHAVHFSLKPFTLGPGKPLAMGNEMFALSRAPPGDLFSSLGLITYSAGPCLAMNPAV